MNSYTELAKKTIEAYIKENLVLEVPGDLPDELMNKRAGVFVTIYNGKDLRGCIGTFLPTRKNIAQEIISNAISACSRDYRFEPILPAELPDLHCEVSLLSEPQEVKDLKKHDPKKHGIIVKAFDGRAGLLLPDLDGIDETDQQIAIAARKGGIDPQNDKIKLLEFEVEKYE